MIRELIDWDWLIDWNILRKKQKKSKFYKRHSPHSLVRGIVIGVRNVFLSKSSQNADKSTNSRMDNELDDRGSRPSDRFEAITTVGGGHFWYC